jgi:hypothetical protein
MMMEALVPKVAPGQLWCIGMKPASKVMDVHCLQSFAMRQKRTHHQLMLHLMTYVLARMRALKLALRMPCLRVEAHVPLLLRAFIRRIQPASNCPGRRK